MIHVTQTERIEIKKRLLDLKQTEKWKGINFSSQFGRVVFVAAGAEWYTLRDLESRIANWFPEHRDTQAAISARLREVSPSRCGLVKQRIMERVNGKQVHRYRLVPPKSIKDVAENVRLTGSKEAA